MNVNARDHTLMKPLADDKRSFTQSIEIHLLEPGLNWKEYPDTVLLDLMQLEQLPGF